GSTQQRLRWRPGGRWRRQQRLSGLSSLRSPLTVGDRTGPCYGHAQGTGPGLASGGRDPAVSKPSPSDAACPPGTREEARKSQPVRPPGAIGGTGKRRVRDPSPDPVAGLRSRRYAGLLVPAVILRRPISAGAPSPVEPPRVLAPALASLSLGVVLGPEAPLIALGGGLAVCAVRLAGRDGSQQAAAVGAAGGGFAAVGGL